MSNNDLAIVILAAGKGTRLKSSLAKVLHRAGGRTLVEQIVRACEPLKARETVVVVGHQAEQVAAVVEPRGALTVLQQPQNGTGHAVQVAKRALGRAKFAVVLPGDAPLVRTETLKALIAAHHSGNAAATILSAVVTDPSGYGRILRKSENSVAAIVEDSQLTPDQRELNEINSSIYCFSADRLWPALAQVKPENKHREIYLTDAIAILAAKGEPVLAQIAPDPREVLGCNTRADLAEVDAIFRERQLYDSHRQCPARRRPRRWRHRRTAYDDLRKPSRWREYGRAIRAYSSGVPSEKRRARWKFCRDEKSGHRRGQQSSAPELHLRRQTGLAHEHRRRNDYLQLRRRE